MKKQAIIAALILATMTQAQARPFAFSIGQREQVTKGLVAYYSMRNSGTTVYDELGANNGTAVNSPTFAVSNGVVGAGVLLNGVQYLSVSNAVGNTPQNFTLSVWVRVDANGAKTIPGIVDRSGSAYNDGGMIVYETALKKFAFYVAAPGWKTARSDVVAFGVWYHVVGLASAGKVEIYVDGVKGPTSSTYGTIIWNRGVNNVQIGAYATGTARNMLVGCVDETRVYDAGLSLD
jgi:hypothetical protein